VVNRRIDYRILGSFEVWVGDRLVGLGGEKPRALLAILLLHHNEVVSADRLIDDLWGESPPDTALRTLQSYVSRLRKTLGSNGASPSHEPESGPAANGGVLFTRGRGYLLEVAPGELDLERFRELAERGRGSLAAGDADEAGTLLREALGIWRGAPLGDFAYEPFAQGAIAQLEELHLAAVEDRVDADLALGRARELVGELRDLVARHPLRERLRGQLMLALYRSGRQAEALGAYQEFRRSLSEELGLEPGPAIHQLELSILGRDPALDLAGAGAASNAGGEVRAAVARRPVPSHRRRLSLAVGSVVLLGLALAAVVIDAGGGRVTQKPGIPGDAVGAINPSGGAIRAVVSLGTSPSSLAAGDGAVWAANANAGTVSRIDPRMRAVVETIQVGSSPSGISVGPGGVWVTNNGSGTLSRIDPAVDRVVQTIAVGNAPTGVAVGYGSVWVANSSDGILTRIDAVTGDLVKTIPLGGAGATGVAVGARAVWVSDEAGDRVLRVDPQTDQVTAAINVGAGPTAIAVGFGSVWVANSLDGTVSRINPVTDGVASTIAAGDGAGGIAVGSGAVWISNQYGGTVSRIAPATDGVARTIAVGSRPEAVAVAGGLVWVGARAAGTGHRGGTLNTVVAEWPDTVDPAQATLAIGTLELTNDGLTAYQRVGGSGSEQVVPDLAVSLPSPTDGGTTYTFRLRRGIRFSDGELVHPVDFRRALERDLILGPDPMYGGPFADVVGGAACAAHPSRCDLSRGVVTDDAANTVTFHLVAPNPEFLARLTLTDAVAVPADAPLRDVGLHALPATGPYMVRPGTTQREATLVRNPYFHEWSHAARPDGYPDRIVYRRAANPEAEITAIERGNADYSFDNVPPDRVSELQTRFASQLYVIPAPGTDELVLNTRVAPFTDVRVRRAINYAVDRATVAGLLGEGSHPSCQALPPYFPGYRPYCPYTLDPNPAGVWHAPNLQRAERLIAASHTKGTPITIWDLGAWSNGYNGYSTVERYVVSLLDRLGYPTTVKDVSADPNAQPRFADSRTREQAALTESNPWYLSASQIIQVNFACPSFLPDSTGNANTSEFCDQHVDAQIDSALAAESDNSPDTAALWAQADRTVTDRAPIVALTVGGSLSFVSARVHNFQNNLQIGPLLDQFWLH
jgi:YVTN family beta-propeller protein